MRTGYGVMPARAQLVHRGYSYSTSMGLRDVRKHHNRVKRRLQPQAAPLAAALPAGWHLPPSTVLSQLGAA